MITRFPGLTPTRSRAVVHNGLVFTVAVSPDPAPPGVYEQTQRALKRIDESLAMSGTDKSRILSAIVYIADITRKEEMNQRLGRMGRPRQSANARLSRRRSRAAASGRDRSHRRAVTRRPQRNLARSFATPLPHSENFSKDVRVPGTCVLSARCRNMPHARHVTLKEANYEDVDHPCRRCGIDRRHFRRQRAELVDGQERHDGQRRHAGDRLGKFCISGPGGALNCQYASLAACQKAVKGSETCQARPSSTTGSKY